MIEKREEKKPSKQAKRKDESRRKQTARRRRTEKVQGKGEGRPGHQVGQRTMQTPTMKEKNANKQEPRQTTTC